MTDWQIKHCTTSLRKFVAILYGTPSKPRRTHFLLFPNSPYSHNFSNTVLIEALELGFSSIISPILMLGFSFGCSGGTSP